MNSPPPPTTLIYYLYTPLFATHTTLRTSVCGPWFFFTPLPGSLGWFVCRGHCRYLCSHCALSAFITVVPILTFGCTPYGLLWLRYAFLPVYTAHPRLTRFLPPTHSLTAFYVPTTTLLRVVDYPAVRLTFLLGWTAGLLVYRTHFAARTPPLRCGWVVRVAHTTVRWRGFTLRCPTPPLQQFRWLSYPAQLF